MSNIIDITLALSNLGWSSVKQKCITKLWQISRPTKNIMPFHMFSETSSELLTLLSSSSYFPFAISSSFSSFSPTSTSTLSPLLTLGPLRASLGRLLLPSSGLTELEELWLLNSCCFLAPFFGLFFGLTLLLTKWKQSSKPDHLLPLTLWSGEELPATPCRPFLTSFSFTLMYSVSF